MTKQDEIKLFWRCTLGDKSHLNIVGKVVCSPFILIMGTVYTLLIVSFEKDVNHEKYI